MSSKKTLNAKNLETLGARHLAELLMEVTRGDAAAKRRLRLDLAGALGPDEVEREVRKRLATIARSRSFIDWTKLKTFTNDLETQHRAIVDHVAKSDPGGALDLMWRFLMLSGRIFERCDDSNGVVIGIFRDACRDLGEIAATANLEPTALADQAFRALTENDYGQYDDLIEVLTPALGAAGLEHLKQRFVDLSKESLPKPDQKDREVIGWASSGPLYADDYAERRRESVVHLALQEIADVQGEVDAFIALKSDKDRTVPAIAAEIAARLLKAGRTEEAWDAINAVDEDRTGWIPFEWEQMRINILVALGREEEAQAFRWACFKRSLDKDHLQAYLKRMPDFDDIAVEERAMSHALQYSSVHQALHFLVSWPALDKVADLIQTRADELDGNHYEILTPAADALEIRYPLAATLLRRALIDFALEKRRVKRYRHAARHLQECARLATSIEDFGSFERHESYMERLKITHARKTSFWDLVS